MRPSLGGAIGRGIGASYSSERCVREGTTFFIELLVRTRSIGRDSLEVAPVLTRINDQDVASLAVLIALAGAGALYQTVAARRRRASALREKVMDPEPPDVIVLGAQWPETTSAL